MQTYVYASITLSVRYMHHFIFRLSHLNRRLLEVSTLTRRITEWSRYTLYTRWRRGTGLAPPYLQTNRRYYYYREISGQLSIQKWIAIPINIIKQPFGWVYNIRLFHPLHHFQQCTERSLYLMYDKTSGMSSGAWSSSNFPPCEVDVVKVKRNLDIMHRF